jgi:hypothetical protein
MAKFKFRHIRNVSRSFLKHCIRDAFETSQVAEYGNDLHRFKDLLNTEHVTICTLIDDGIDLDFYAFCRGDQFSKELGRYYSENRARSAMELPLLPNPVEEREKQRAERVLKAREKARVARDKAFEEKHVEWCSMQEAFKSALEDHPLVTKNEDGTLSLDEAKEPINPSQDGWTRGGDMG